MGATPNRFVNGYAAPVYRSLKVPTIQRDAYVVTLEHTDGITLTHCDVFAPWSPAVKRALKADFEALVSLRNSPLFVAVPSGDRKLAKFVQLFGFEPTKTSVKTAGNASATLYIK